MIETTPPGMVVPGATSPGGVAESEPAQRWWRSGSALFRGHPLRFDAALAVLIFVLNVGGMLSAHRMGVDDPPPGWAWVVAAIGCGALLFRRTQPWPVLFITSA